MQKAPRTGLGWDADGRLLLLQIDGEEDVNAGMDLYQFADLFISVGAVNAVNLDGGGSSVTVVGGEVASKPTCDDTSRICVRRVTTIVCAK